MEDARAAWDWLARQHPGRARYIFGHSLGGALAIICALDLSMMNLPIAGVYTFGQPRVGDAAFAAHYNNELRDLTFRVVNQNDIVPRTPGVLMGYRHCGNEVFMQPVAGWGFNPSVPVKLLFDTLGFWGAYRNRSDVLVNNHLISNYIARMKGIV